jgi:hypothetical protein
MQAMRGTSCSYALVVSVLFIMTLTGAWSTHAARAQTGAQGQQPQASPASADSLNADVHRLSDQGSRVEDELKRVSALAKQTDERVSRYVWWAKWIIGLGAPLATVLAFFGWQTIRGTIRRYVERNLDRHLTKALQDSLPTRLAEIQTRAESYLLRVAQVLALRAQNAYDEALAVYGWDGHVTSLRKETPTIRRAIIECLYSARNDRKPRRDPLCQHG